MKRTLLLLLLAASPAWGQAPPTPPPPVFPVAVITAPATVPAGAPLVAFGDQSVTNSRLTWQVVYPKQPFEVWNSDKFPGGMFLIRQPTPGVTYRLALVAYGTGEPAFAFDFVDIPVGIPGKPDPKPDPEPDPPAPPAPATLLPPFFVEVVTDPKAPTLALAQIVDSVTLGPAIKALGGSFQPMALNGETFTLRNLSKYVGDGPGLVKVPALIVRDAKGLKVIGEPVPATEAALLARIKALAGAPQ